jgi:sulfotransferase family protein
MKSGTTSLWHYLRTHPQVFMPLRKELHFFSVEDNWKRGLGWYEGQFQEASDGAVAIGEASASYSKYPTFPEVPSRIARSLPGVRFIYVVRHPIDRMRSQYLHDMAKGRERRSIEKAILSNHAYVNYSLYAMQIARYKDFFPREQLLIITAEELRDARGETMRRVHDFLAIDDDWLAPNLDIEFLRASERQAIRPSARALRSLPGVGTLARLAPRSLKRRLVMTELETGRATISGELRSRLEGLLRDDVKQLRTYLGGDFDGWGIG